MSGTTLSRAEFSIVRPEAFATLSHEDRAALAGLERTPPLRAEARRDLVREGDAPRTLRLILSGWACRYKSLPDGRRQYVGILLPGDFCQLDVCRMDHSVGAITPVTYTKIAPASLERIIAARPRIGQALKWQGLVSASIQREWLLSVGQRSARERVAHLLVELFLRLRAIDLADGDSCDFPITQSDLAEATGLTPVHVNRTLQDLRREGLVELAQKRLAIPDLAALKRAALFKPDYLHLGEQGAYIA